jgi:signal transduction histidine kinase
MEHQFKKSFLVDDLFGKAMIGTHGHFFLFVMVFALSLYDGSFIPLSVVFFLGHALTWLSKLIVINQYRKLRLTREEVKSNDFSQYYLVLTTFNAVLWSAWISFILFTHGFESKIFTINLVILSGIAASSTLSLGSSRRGHRLFISCIFLWLLALATYFTHDPYSIVLAVISGVFLIYLLKIGDFIHQSISERSEYLFLTRNESSKVKRILETLPGVVSLFDTQLRYIFASNQLGELFDLDNVDSFIGRPLGWSEKNPEFRELIQNFANSPELTRRSLIELAMKGEKKAWFEIYLSKKAIDKNILVFSLNVDERIRLESQLKEEQLRLAQASRLASIGEMAAGIAHEVNNPLTIILGKTRLMLREFHQSPDKSVSPDKLEAGLLKIEETSTRISKIIKGLKTFSRDADDAQIERVSFDHLIEDALAVSRERANQLGIKLTVEGCTLENIIFANIVGTNQVFLNLLNNAFDALEGQENAWVRVVHELNENSIVIKVMDSGPGIPANIKDKIFDPFFTTKQVGRGTGLGLGICKGLLEKMGGTIELDTKSANTCFVITLQIERKQTQAS